MTQETLAEFLQRVTWSSQISAELAKYSEEALAAPVDWLNPEVQQKELNFRIGQYGLSSKQVTEFISFVLQTITDHSDKLSYSQWASILLPVMNEMKVPNVHDLDLLLDYAEDTLGRRREVPVRKNILLTMLVALFDKGNLELFRKNQRLYFTHNSGEEFVEQYVVRDIGLVKLTFKRELFDMFDKEVGTFFCSGAEPLTLADVPDLIRQVRTTTVTKLLKKPKLIQRIKDKVSKWRRKASFLSALFAKALVPPKVTLLPPHN